MAHLMSLTSQPDVEAALHNPTLVPPSAHAAMTPGSTLDLRNAMARFSSGPDHAGRRHTVIEAIGSIDLQRAQARAAERTRVRLDGGVVDGVKGIARCVPTETMADLLGLGPLANDLRTDVLAIVEVIGRGAPSSQRSDDAADRLTALLSSQSAGAVATISMLYQNHDATAAYISSAIYASATGQPRRCALARTLRVATADIAIGPTSVPAGGTLALDLEASRFEFGAGAHECPGQELALAITSGVLAAITEVGYRLAIDRTVFADDGRPSQLLLEPRSR